MSLDEFLAKLSGVKETPKGFSALCPSHHDKSPSLSVTEAPDGKILVKCHAGCSSEAVCQALGLTVSDLFPENGTRQRSEGPTPYKSNPRAATPLGTPSKTKNPNGPKSEIEKIYSYKDALGREIYQVVRLKPKDFRQRHNVEGKWVWNMEGVERVLYRLPEVLKADTVWIVEGEKDADNLAELGFTATCNVGGAGKWMNGYTETLLDKHLVLCGDNDKPGSAHIEKVLESVASTAKSVRIVKIPTPHKDASDLIHASGNDAKAVLEKLHAEGTPIVGGLPLPVYSIADIEPLYAAHPRP